MDREDVKAYRAMTLGQRLARALRFIEQARQFKAASVRVHHPGWTEQQINREVALWVSDGMRPEELYEV